MILVVGASSKPGQKLIPMLVDKGYQVRALTRNPQQLDFAHFPGIEVIEGDLRQPDTLLRACEGVDVWRACSLRHFPRARRTFSG
jgi:uncharacterized protein YbjT (DUF2867 family)